MPRPKVSAPATTLPPKLRRALAVADDALLFPSENLRTPVKYENLWQREIKPRFTKIGLAWVDFRCMRPTNSTLMRAAGADAKVSAGNRGHSLKVAMQKLEDLIQ